MPSLFTSLRGKISTKPLDRLESLVIDRDGELRDGFAAEWTPPRRGSRPVPLWTVVQDSRGGTTTARIDVFVE